MKAEGQSNTRSLSEVAIDKGKFLPRGRLSTSTLKNHDVIRVHCFRLK